MDLAGIVDKQWQYIGRGQYPRIVASPVVNRNFKEDATKNDFQYCSKTCKIVDKKGPAKIKQYLSVEHVPERFQELYEDVMQAFDFDEDFGSVLGFCKQCKTYVSTWKLLVVGESG